MAAPSIGGFFSKLFGSENKERIDLNDPRLKPDPGAYNYGGDPNGAKRAAANAGANQNNFTGQANEAWGQGTGALDNANGARNQQQEAAALTMRRATGAVPSVTQQAADRQMQQVVAAQRSGLASARSPAGIAAAQRNAAAATAAGQANVAGQAQVNEAAERAAAEGQAQQAFTGIRQQDLGAANTAFGAGANAGQLGLGYGQLGHQINATQLGAKMNEQAQKSANLLGAAGINAGVGGQNAAINQQNALGAVNMAAQGLGVAAGGAGGGDIKKAATGGPIYPGENVLVGEEGPELVVPQFGLAHARNNGPAAAAASPSFAGSAGMLGGSPMGELKAHSDFATRFQRQPGAAPMLYEARKDGGPVTQYRPYVVGEEGPELIVPEQAGTVIPAPQTAQILAQSTWGTGAGTTGPQADAFAQHNVDAANHAYAQNRVDEADKQRFSGAGPMAIANPIAVQHQRDEETSAVARGKRDRDVELSDKEEYEANDADRRLAKDRKANAGKPKGPNEAASAPQRGLASAISSTAGKMADRVDVGYHGPSAGYVPPNLIPIGAREGGGPVDKGKPYVVGEKGPEMVVPKKRTPEEEAAYAAGVADAPMHYGGALASDMNTVPMLLASARGADIAGAAKDTAKTALGPATLLADYFSRGRR